MQIDNPTWEIESLTIGLQDKEAMSAARDGDKPINHDPIQRGDIGFTAVNIIVISLYSYCE